MPRSIVQNLGLFRKVFFGYNGHIDTKVNIVYRSYSY